MKRLSFLNQSGFNYLIDPGFIFFDEDFFFDFEERVFEYFGDVFGDVIIGFDDEFFFLIEAKFWGFALVDVCKDECAARLEHAGDFIESFR